MLLSKPNELSVEVDEALIRLKKNLRITQTETMAKSTEDDSWGGWSQVLCLVKNTTHPEPSRGGRSIIVRDTFMNVNKDSLHISSIFFIQQLLPQGALNWR